ncbi:Imm63 family immunity protein [Neobacillus sp. Marseille-QA0830]
MSRKSLEEIKELIERHAQSIHAPLHLHPTYGYSQDFARPHIEVDQKGYHYIIVERGVELKRVTTEELDELLFHVFDGITFSMALDFELDNRDNTQDFRRILFKKQEELLGIINKEWAVRKEREHEQILGRHPYSDS